MFSNVTKDSNRSFKRAESKVQPTLQQPLNFSVSPIVISNINKLKKKGYEL